MNSVQVTLVLAVICAVPLILMLRVAILSRRKKSSRGALELVGRLASVEHPLTPEGTVLVDGEMWRARTRTGEEVARGSVNVRILGARGHLLEVERAEVATHTSGVTEAGAACGTRSA